MFYKLILLFKKINNQAAMAHLATADGLADYNSTRNAGVLTFGAPRTFYSSCSDVETNTRPWPKSAINFFRKLFLIEKWLTAYIPF